MACARMHTHTDARTHRHTHGIDSCRALTRGMDLGVTACLLDSSSIRGDVRDTEADKKWTDSRGDRSCLRAVPPPRIPWQQGRAEQGGAGVDQDSQ
jgi:hypothetical protein